MVIEEIILSEISQRELQILHDLCKSKKNENLIKKEIRFVVIRNRISGEGEMDKGDQKLQIFSYKNNKYKRQYVQHYVTVTTGCMTHLKAVKTIDPKSSRHREKISFLVYMR